MGMELYFKEFTHKANLTLQENDFLAICVMFDGISPFNGFYINRNAISRAGIKYTSKRHSKIVESLTKKGLLIKTDSDKYKLNVELSENKGSISLIEYFRLNNAYDKELFSFLSSRCYFSQFKYTLFWNRVKSIFGGLSKIKRAVARINKKTSLILSYKVTKRGVEFKIIKPSHVFSNPKTKLTGSLLYKTTNQYKQKRDKAINKNRDKKREEIKKIEVKPEIVIQTKKSQIDYQFDSLNSKFSCVNEMWSTFISFVETRDIDFANRLKEYDNIDVAYSINEVRCEVLFDRWRRYL